MTVSSNYAAGYARKSLFLVAATDPRAMESIPGLSELISKLFSQCGLLTICFFAAMVWLSIQLAKSRSVSEADRSSYMKLYNEQNAVYEKLAIAQAEIRTLLFALQSRSASDDD